MITRGSVRFGGDQMTIEQMAEKIKVMLKDYTIKEQDDIISLVVNKLEEN